MRKFLSLLVVLLTTFTSAWADTKEYVNLGLPSGLLWATCNVGATNPQDYGDYFAWGETSPYYTDGNAQSTEATGIWKSGKESGYEIASYFDTTDGGSTFTKYNLTGGKTVLESANDAATQSAAWGAGWRMPTSAELLELAGGCFLEWTDDYKSTGVKGIIVYKNKNTTGDGDKGYFLSGTTWKKLSGTSYGTDTQPEGYVAYTTSDTHIFLPAAGWRYGTDLNVVGSFGCYWSSSLDTSIPGNAFGLMFSSDDVNPQNNSGGRYSGLSVRPVRNNYLCFTAQEATDVSFNITGTLTTTPSLQYSKEQAAWTDYSFTEGDNHTISLAAGEKVYFKAGKADGTVTSNSTFSEDWGKYITFSSTKKVAASGNIMSLLDATCESKTVPVFAFCGLFQQCTSLTAAPELPATELAGACYCFMFYGCTSLTTAPNLPATELAESCYNGMFWGCTSLTTAPALPATELAISCYNCMFFGCTSLTTAPELPSSELPICCYSEMFASCTNLIVNTTAPGIEWKINATSVGANALLDMFTNTGGTLTGAPTNGTTYYIASLPAVKLNSKGYATYSSAHPFKVTTTDVETYKAKVDNDKINLTKVTGNIKEDQGILLYGGETKANTYAHFQWVSTADAITDNDLKPTTTATTPVIAYETAWVLGDENQFLRFSGSAFVANRAYIPTTVHPFPAPGAKMTLVFGDETTAISNVNANPNANQAREGKYIENGRIVILKNGRKFNANGQQIK